MLRSADMSELWILPHDSHQPIELDSGVPGRSFFSECDDGQQPAVVRGGAALWPLKGETATNICARFPGAPMRVRVSTATDENMCYMSGQCFDEYLRACEDRSCLDAEPLFVFDNDMGGGPVSDFIKQSHRMPSFLSGSANLLNDDVFNRAGIPRALRPSKRWLIAAPARSGSRWHVDRALCSAWNALCSGHKRWALYPPGRAPQGVRVVPKGKGDSKAIGPTALEWFSKFYPLLDEEERPIEFIQSPGDVVYVPSGWWHCVLNLDETLCITENFTNHEIIIGAANRRVVRYPCRCRRCTNAAASKAAVQNCFAFLPTKGEAGARWAEHVADDSTELQQALRSLGLLSNVT